MSEQIEVFYAVLENVEREKAHKDKTTIPW